MLSIIDRIPPGVIEAIGTAPGIGRDRWMALADLAEAKQTTPGEAAALAAGENSDERFASLMWALTLSERRAREADAAAARERAKPVRLNGIDGSDLGQVRRSKDKVTLVLGDTGPDGFADWLVDHIADLHRDWQNR